MIISQNSIPTDFGVLSVLAEVGLGNPLYLPEVLLWELVAAPEVTQSWLVPTQKLHAITLCVGTLLVPL